MCPVSATLKDMGDQGHLVSPTFVNECQYVNIWVITRDHSFRSKFFEIPQAVCGKLSKFRSLCVVLGMVMDSWCYAVNSLLTTRFIPHVQSLRKDMSCT